MRCTSLVSSKQPHRQPHQDEPRSSASGDKTNRGILTRDNLADHEGGRYKIRERPYRIPERRSLSRIQS
jgi:hypothetical protein